MLEKIEAGKEYWNGYRNIVKVLFVDDKSVLHEYLYDGTRTCVGVSFALTNWEEIPTPKKRYWLWDVKSSSGEVFKASTYMDENGVASNDITEYDKDQLIKKHENEWIEV